MINHYLTLKKIAESLNSVLTGCKVIDCFTQTKGEIVLSFINGNDEVINLAICLGTTNYTLFISNRLVRARSNTADVFSEILGDTLQAVEIAINNRAVKFRFISHSVVVELFGANRNAVYILNSDQIVVSSTKNVAEHRGEKYSFPPCLMKEPQNTDAFASVGDLLCKSTLLIPKPTANEFLSLHNLTFSTPTAGIENINDLIADAYLLRYDLENSDKFYLYRDNDSALLSLLPIKSAEDENGTPPQIYYDINTAVAVRYAYDKRIANLEDNRSALLKKFVDLKNKTDRNIDICNKVAEMAGKIDEYKHYAELLLAYPDQKFKPENESVQFEDWDGNLLIIKTNKTLSISENVVAYYAKAKKLKADIAAKKMLLPKYTEKSKALSDMIERIKNINNIKDLNRFSKEISDEGNNQLKQVVNTAETKYRQFDLGNGYMLYVGKNATNNDDLTVNFARPNDFWFHARSCAGSHAVLRSGNAKESRPPKDILKIVAGIVAYYSKQKNARMVPVSWTQKKFVYKPRNAAPGEVMMKREDVIMAEPKLPEE